MSRAIEFISCMDNQELVDQLVTTASHIIISATTILFTLRFKIYHQLYQIREPAFFALEALLGVYPVTRYFKTAQVKANWGSIKTPAYAALKADWVAANQGQVAEIKGDLLKKSAAMRVLKDTCWERGSTYEDNASRAWEVVYPWLLQDARDDVIAQRRVLVGNPDVRAIRAMFRRNIVEFKTAHEINPICRWWDRATADNPTASTVVQLKTEHSMTISCNADFNALAKLRKTLENSAILANNPGDKASERVLSKAMSDKITEILEVR
jgi:hypothetical protein